MSAAYEGLSETLRESIAPLRAWHDWKAVSATQYDAAIVVESDLDGANRALHPVVRTHAETGLKSLFVNPGFTLRLDGFEKSESDTVLGMLFDHAARPEFLYRHRWRQGDVVMWDNRTTMHYAVNDYGEVPRYMERTTVIGERPA